MTLKTHHHRALVDDAHHTLIAAVMEAKRDLASYRMWHRGAGEQTPEEASLAQGVQYHSTKLGQALEALSTFESTHGLEEEIN